MVSVMIPKVCNYCSASSRPQGSRKSNANDSNSPPACTRASPSSRSSNPSTWHFRLPVCQFIFLLPERSRGRCRRTCAACAEDTLIPSFLVSFPFASSIFASPDLRIDHSSTYQSSGSSSITNCAAAARALSSFDIL